VDKYFFINVLNCFLVKCELSFKLAVLCNINVIKIYVLIKISTDKNEMFNTRKKVCKVPMPIFTTVCPRSSYPFYIVIYYSKWVTTSWTHTMMLK